MSETNGNGAGFEHVRTSKEFFRLCSPPPEPLVMGMPRVDHQIQNRGAPVYARPRRLMPDKLAEAKFELKELLDRGIFVLRLRHGSVPYI